MENLEKREKDVAPQPRTPGSCKGQIWIAPDFNDPLPDEVIDLFYNGPIFPRTEIVQAEEKGDSPGDGE